jgi:hypothetical protein
MDFVYDDNSKFENQKKRFGMIHTKTKLKNQVRMK